jgi:transcriptional regulator with XRE-family HTH domain
MLGDNIRRLMKENGYTQNQLAIRADCTESAISYYINNKREPCLRILARIAIALGVSVDTLLEGYETGAKTICKYNLNDICVNSHCPFRADYCPVYEDDSICKYRE